MGAAGAPADDPGRHPMWSAVCTTSPSQSLSVSAAEILVSGGTLLQQVWTGTPLVLPPLGRAECSGVPPCDL